MALSQGFERRRATLTTRARDRCAPTQISRLDKRQRCQPPETIDLRLTVEVFCQIRNDIWSHSTDDNGSASMNRKQTNAAGIFVFIATAMAAAGLLWTDSRWSEPIPLGAVSSRRAVARDTSQPLAVMAGGAAQLSSNAESSEEEEEDNGEADADMPKNVVAPQGAASEPTPGTTAAVTIPPEAVAIEQTKPGAKPSPESIASFDGLGEGFEGPQGTARFINPSDCSLAVGPDHIVQIVNTRMAVFTKKGKRFDTTGKVLYGPVATGNVFQGFFGEGVELNNGDAVVRYDQLADRWLIVMPIFRRLPPRANEPPRAQGGRARTAQSGGSQGAARRSSAVASA